MRCIHVQKKKLSECVQKARDEKETAEAECDLVKEKARELKLLFGTQYGDV